MKNLILIAAASAAFASPQVASAQALPAAVVAIADVNRASAQCTACKVAVAALEGQLNGLKSLQASLDSSLGTEARSIQALFHDGKRKEAMIALERHAHDIGPILPSDLTHSSGH